MSYSPDSHKELVNSEEQRLNHDMVICLDVRATVKSPGWENTIGPLLDRMIVDVVGGKIGDTWVDGKLNRARKDERREFYVGYKQALIDLHNRVIFHVDQVKLLEERLKQLEIDKSQRFRVPLIDDTRYRPED